MTLKHESSVHFRIYPVGVVRNEIEKPMIGADESGVRITEHMDKVRREQQRIRDMVSELEIFPEVEGVLEGIGGFSHLMILYWPHLISEERRNLRKINPMGRKEIPEKGIFATCSPARPNPVLVSTVRLLSLKGSTLKVRGLEAVNGSPLIDIKPFVQRIHGADEPAVPDWMQKIHAELDGLGDPHSGTPQHED
ncbi:MAG: tRNA (N6-threonylcarbamoyladenosine(37)-N6)-methyltransferase TrmO [Desulfosalsimonadaceae bacterium]